MLGLDASEEFRRDGLIRIPGAFSDAAAARMCDVLWTEMSQRHGMDRDDPATWTTPRPTTFKTSKRHSSADAILGAPLRSALDDLFGAGQWIEPPHQGQVLVTLPTGEPWAVPHRQWHTDVGFDLPTDTLVAVKIWALLAELAPGGGGTPQVAGSHWVIERYLRSTAEREFTAVRDGVLRSDPWLRRLTAADDTDPDRSQALMSEGRVAGLPVRVVELTGAAGDVFVTHPWILHSIAANSLSTPRMMRSRVIWRAGWPRADFTPD